jgi:hypothetical protein
LPLPLRVFVLVLFALGLVLQPVFASIGELHELAHDPSGSHAVAHTDHSNSVGNELSAAEELDPAPAGTLHFLMHHAPCCGQSAMAVLQTVRVAPIALGASCPVLGEPQRLLQAPSLAPFRPPISV